MSERTIEQIHLIEDLFYDGERIPYSVLSKKDEPTLRNFYTDASNISFKSNFKKTLYSFFFSFGMKKSKMKERHFHFIQLKRLLAVADILLSFEARKSAIKIYEKSFKIAQEQDLNWALLISSRVLRKHYGVYDFNRRKLNKYSEILSNSQERVENEILCEQYFISLAQQFHKTKEHTQELKELASEAFELLSGISLDKRTILFNRHYLVISVVYYEVRNEINDLVDFVILEIEKLKLHPLQLSYDLNVAYKKLCDYSLRVERFDVFRNVLIKGKESIKLNSVSWYRYQELQSLYFIRTAKYSEAQKILIELKSRSGFQVIHNSIKLRIDLKLMYTTMFLLFKRQNIRYNSKLIEGNIDLIVKIPEYSKDKKAMNICLIILQLLVHIWKRDFDILEVKFEAIDKYLRRYTRSSPLFRSHSFIKILMSIRRYKFVILGAERNYRKYMKHLKSMPYAISPHPGEIEIIYYENLVEVIESYLSGNVARSAYS